MAGDKKEKVTKHKVTSEFKVGKKQYKAGDTFVAESDDDRAKVKLYVDGGTGVTTEVETDPKTKKRRIRNNLEEGFKK